MSGMVERDQEYCLHGVGYIPASIVKAEGARFWDSNGREYLDMMCQTAGVAALGHGHPKVLNAIRRQLEQPVPLHQFTAFVNDARTVFTEKLAAVMPGSMRNNCKMYVSGGGSEANEVALKMAMLSSGRRGVISTYYSYHGATLALLGLMGQSYMQQGPYPSIPGFSQIPNAYCYRCAFGQKPESCGLECAEALQRAITYGSREEVGAFIQETVPGNGGHMIPPKAYFKRIREICDEHNILYIVDEVQTGVGRSGKWWSCEYFDFEPDILVTAKGIGGGMPLAATVIRNGLLPDEHIRGNWHIFTFGGSPLSCASGSAVIDAIIEEDVLAHAAELGKYLEERLSALQEASRIIGDVRCMGLFIGVEIVRDKETKEFWPEGALAVGKKCFDKGVLYFVSNMAGYGNTIKIKPPLNLTHQEADQAMDVLEAAVSEVESEM